MLANIEQLNSFLVNQTSATQWPTVDVIEVNEDKHTIVLALTISPDLEYFSGHFPDQPVLPGVVQIHWAGEMAKRLFSLVNFSALQGAKFNSMVLPNTTVYLSLQYKPEKNSVRFSYFLQDDKFSVGSILFSGVEAPTRL